MTLATIRPRLATHTATAAPMLQQKAGVVAQRLRGSAGVKHRREVAEAHRYRCTKCGKPWVKGRDHVDHRIALDDGGTNDPENMQLLCSEPCHRLKTEAEARARARG